MRPLHSLLLLALALTLLASSGEAGKFLFYMAFVSKSMKITFMPIVEELAARGHEVRYHTHIYCMEGEKSVRKT